MPIVKIHKDSFSLSDCNLSSENYKVSLNLRENNFRDSSNTLKVPWKIVVLGDAEVILVIY